MHVGRGCNSAALDVIVTVLQVAVACTDGPDAAACVGGGGGVEQQFEHAIAQANQV